MYGAASLFDREGNRKYLNSAERLRFYEAARMLPDPLQRTFCLTLFYTGCRISEALHLKQGNIDLSERLLIFRTLKQRTKIRYRGVHAPDELLEILGLGKGGARSDRVWDFSRTAGWKIVKRCMADAGLDGIKATPKGLRHSFAIAHISAGTPLNLVQKWMGHARTSTTMIYLDFIGDDERALAGNIWPKTATKTGKGA